MPGFELEGIHAELKKRLPGLNGWEDLRVS